MNREQISIAFPKEKVYILENIKREADKLNIKPTPLIIDALEKTFGFQDPVDFREELIRQHQREIDKLQTEVLDIKRQAKDQYAERYNIIKHHYTKFLKYRMDLVKYEGKEINLLNWIKKHMNDDYYDLVNTGLSPEEILEHELKLFKDEMGVAFNE